MFADFLAVHQHVTGAGASILIEASLNFHCELRLLGNVQAHFASDEWSQKVGWAYAVVTLPPVVMANG